ncbi:heparinase II/III family protein [Nonomuraea diastatica]|uniref:Heparinase n=1 Tax=Nonomuraea diastatica TaxID=1848329 RepID=A0A4R4WC37_9ACTN|nr:heparinase II/III family protein [Nonomuraea diastatica]TDD13833.1 hypothetical protein E1294_39565 [Nonomuraea diastatica]
MSRDGSRDLLVRQAREEAARARTESLPALTFALWRRYADTGDRQAYERVYFERRRRLAALMLAAHLDDRPDPALDDLLWSVCDEYTWVLPAHEPRDRPVNAFVDLFAAETGHALAEAVDLLGEHLDSRVRARVREEVERRVLRPLQEGAPPLWWEQAGHNWAAVCAGAAGMAALALDSEHLPALLPRLERALESFLAGVGPDGACLEGPDYWSYGFGYFVYFAEALRERTGRDLLDDPHVREMAAYPARVDLGGGVRPAFADSSGMGAYPAGLLDRLAERLGVPVPQGREPSFHDDHCYRWAHLSRTLWWTARTPRTPPARHDRLPDAAIVVARADGTAFAAKGGHNDEPHNHLDLGHFVLHAHGRTVLDDLGAPEYTRDYFGAGRYAVPQASAEWHSIPLIDGAAQRPGRDRRAETVRYAAGHDTVEWTLDLTAAYDAPRLIRFTRAFAWRPGRLELTDTFAFSGGDCPVAELFVARLRPEVGRGAVGWGPVVLEIPPPWRARAEELEVRGHDGVPETVHRVRLTAAVPSGPHTFVFTVR